jgi:rhamnogalacturonan acetylesterase
VCFFDDAKIHVYNEARGGRSSRSYIEEGAWARVLEQILPGDFVILQFAHNDTRNSPNHTDRATITSAGDETIQVGISGQHQVIHSYGWYLRQYVSDAKTKGATVIVCSLVPRNEWTDGRIKRGFDGYAPWAADAARASGAAFIDLNTLAADRFDAIGQENARGSSTTASIRERRALASTPNASSAGIRKLTDVSLAAALKPSNPSPFFPCLPLRCWPPVRAPRRFPFLPPDRPAQAARKERPWPASLKRSNLPGLATRSESRPAPYGPARSIPLADKNPATAPIRIEVVSGARAVLDVSRAGKDRRDHGFGISGDYWHLVGIEVTGAAGFGISVTGHHNVVERCRADANLNTGINVGAPASHTLVDRRIKYLFDQNLHDLPDEVRRLCHQNGHTYPSVYGRMKWDKPAQTITYGFLSPGRGRFIHPIRPRTLTLNEGARIQGFPDGFKFHEAASRTTASRMIADAVPPPLGRVVGLAAAAALE